MAISWAQRIHSKVKGELKDSRRNVLTEKQKTEKRMKAKERRMKEGRVCDVFELRWNLQTI